MSSASSNCPFDTPLISTVSKLGPGGREDTGEGRELEGAVGGDMPGEAYPNLGTVEAIEGLEF